MKIKNTLSVTWKITSRNPMLWILLLLYYFYFYYGVSYYTSAHDYSPGKALIQMSFVIQFGLLVFLLIGILFVRIEEKHNLDDVFRTIHNGMFIKTTGKLLYGFMFILVLISTSFLYYAYKLYTTGTAISHFYWSAYQYIFLYWGLSFLISMLIGALLAYIFKGKVIYPLAIFIWAIIGPINEIFLGTTANKLHLEEVLYFINLGEPNPYSPFDAFYGFSLDDFHWIKKLVFILAIVGLYCLANLIKRGVNRKVLYSFLAALLILTPSILYLFKGQQLYISASDVNESRENYDYSYYLNKDDMTIEKEISDVKVESYDIDLAIENNLLVTVQMVVTNTQNHPLNKVNFSLYHDLILEYVEVNQENVSFKQNQDIIEIELEEPLEVGGKATVKVSYSGKSSPLFFANEQAIYLPYYFPWLPSTILKPSFKVSEYGELFRENHELDYKTTFTLRFEGSQQIFTNLPKYSEQTWKGESTGVTIVAGELNEYKVGDVEIVQPNSWSKPTKKEFEKLKEKTDNLIDDVSMKLGVNNIETPNKIFHLPILSISDNQSSQRIWITNGYMIFGRNLAYQDSIYLEDDLEFAYTYWAVPALTWKPLHVNNSFFANFFSDAYSFVYNKQNNIPDEGVLLPDNISGSNEEIQAVTNVIKWLKESHDDGSVNAFLSDWFQLVIRGDNNWSDLLELVEEYNKEV